jgi:nucleotidyltransferase/DNA polymerase involved in DNA repair
MDAFFAAIEQRDNPDLRGRPVVVGADPRGGTGRGVVSTCSYEAREFGIRSAMPISQAWGRCPEAAYLPVDGEKYQRESRHVRELLEEFTPQIQFASIDEAYLDVTGSLRLFGGKRALAEALQRRVAEATGLTCSLGVAPSRLVAKIASDLEKPCGLVIVQPGEVEAFLAPLAIRRLPGVGPRMQEELGRRGIRTFGDLQACTRDELGSWFGAGAEDLWRRARGLDDSPVSEGEGAKSVGHEHTFAEDTGDWVAIGTQLLHLCEKTARRLRKAGLKGRTVTTKVRFSDFTTVTRQRTLNAPVDDATSVHRAALANLEAAETGERQLRLIGVQVSGFDEAGPSARQARLFADPSSARGDAVRRRLAEAEDAVKDKFGEDAIRRGGSMGPGDGRADD